MEQLLLLCAAFIAGLVVMLIVTKASEIVEGKDKLTPAQEAEFELETRPVYAYATINDGNVNEVIEAQILHVQDPSRYPEVPAYEARKNETHE